MNGKPAAVTDLERVNGAQSPKTCGQCLHSEDVPESLGRAVRCIEGPPGPILTRDGVLFVFPLMQVGASCHRWAARVSAPSPEVQS